MTSGDVVGLRLMTEADLPMLHAWLNRPHVVAWWGGPGPSMDEVREGYAPRVLARANVTPYIGLLDGEPFAYAQSYVALGAGDGWWEDETDAGVRGIDQSIADPDLLGKGLGTRLVDALADLLFSDPQVSKLQTDPAPHNLRAIRCYEKAGFRKVEAIVTPDGPAIYMLRDRADPAVATHAASSIVIRMLGRGDAAVLRRVAAGVFDNSVDPALAEEFLADPRHHLAVASSADLVVGMASAVHYVHPDKPAELWVNEVGVAPAFRRQGLGKRLLQALFAQGRALGCSEAWLGTEGENAAARRLYAAAGGNEEAMVYVTFPLDRSTDAASLPHSD